MSSPRLVSAQLQRTRLSTNGQMVMMDVEGQAIGFWVRDRRLICPACGTPSQAPSDTCYGCEGHPLTDPFRPGRPISHSPEPRELRRRSVW